MSFWVHNGGPGDQVLYGSALRSKGTSVRKRAGTIHPVTNHATKKLLDWVSSRKDKNTNGTGIAVEVISLILFLDDRETYCLNICTRVNVPDDRFKCSHALMMHSTISRCREIHHPWSAEMAITK